MVGSGSAGGEDKTTLSKFSTKENETAKEKTKLEEGSKISDGSGKTADSARREKELETLSCNARQKGKGRNGQVTGGS